MGQRVYQVDAFTDRPFAGNPAAVCVLTEPADPAWMQLVAREMNLSETAFLIRQQDGFDLRWFTPAIEVELCGHATLASAHILWERDLLTKGEEARFHTLSGLLTAQQKGDEIELNFPATPAGPVQEPQGLAEALGIATKSVAKSRFDYLVEVESDKQVRNLKPDFNHLKALEARGIIVTSLSDSEEFDFVSRFFAPAAGIDEDPVTGSAHCCLGPFWSERLGKKDLSAYQASARGGSMRVMVEADRVRLAGRAVTVMIGELVGTAG